MNRAIRQTRSAATEFKAREIEGDLFIEGYFSVFNTRYELWDGAAETVVPGAFSEALSADIRALANHDTRIVIGRTKSGTLELKEDNRGLWGRIRVNKDDVDAMNLYYRVQRGDVDQCSFGFDILGEEYEEDAITGNVLWKITKVRLYEVSVVTFPAYEETSVKAREQDFAEIQRRKHEAWQGAARKKLKGDQTSC